VLPTVHQGLGLYNAVRTLSSNSRTLYTSFQFPWKNSEELLCYGSCGEKVPIQLACEAARVCAINVIAQLQQAAALHISNLDAIKLIQVIGNIQCSSTFTDAPKVLDAASAIFLDVFGSISGAHSRLLIQSSTTPINSPVMISCIAQIV